MNLVCSKWNNVTFDQHLHYTQSKLKTIKQKKHGKHNPNPGTKKQWMESNGHLISSTWRTRYFIFIHTMPWVVCNVSFDTPDHTQCCRFDDGK